MKTQLSRISRISFLPLLTLTLLLAAGCGPAAKTTPPTASKAALTQAVGKTWQLDRWTGTDGSRQTTGTITIAFASEENQTFRASGNASVNRYTGPVTFTATGATDFTSPGFAVTRMMGLPEPQAREDRYLAELRLIRAAALENGRLILTGDGSLRMEFVPEQ